MKVKCQLYVLSQTKRHTYTHQNHTRHTGEVGHTDGDQSTVLGDAKGPGVEIDERDEIEDNVLQGVDVSVGDGERACADLL
jgi:hypothetical protein